MPHDLRDVRASDPLFTEDATTSQIKQADGSYIDMVGTTSGKFSDGFNDVALDTTDKWDVVRNTGGITFPEVGGNLVVTLGTTDQAELLLVARQTVTIPANVLAVLSISQRIAGNRVSFGYLEVDDLGVPVPHSTIPFEFRNSIRKSFTGIVTTTSSLEAMSTNAAALVSVAETTVSSTTMGDHTVYSRIDGSISVSGTANSTAAKSSGGARLSTQAPSPNRKYRAFMHFQNTSVPASSTVVNVARFVSIDIQELEAQVTMGDGVSLASQAVPTVNTATGTASQTVQGAAASGASTVTNPIQAGLLTTGAAPTAIATARTMSAQGDVQGRQITQPLGVPQSHVFGRALLTAAGTDVTLVALLALNRTILQSITIANRDNIPHTVELYDTAGGTLRDAITLMAGDTKQLIYPAGLPNAALATAWVVRVREAATTAVEVSCSGYRATA